MDGDIVPYAAHYHSCLHHPSLFWSFCFMVRLTLYNMEKPRQESDPDPVIHPLSPGDPRQGHTAYDHNGVSDMLKECINFYEDLLDIENTLKQFQSHNLSRLEQKWMALELEYLELEQFVEALKDNLMSRNLGKKLITSKPGRFLLNEYLNSEGKIEIRHMPHVVNWTKSIIQQRDSLQDEMLLPISTKYNLAVCNSTFRSNFGRKSENLFNMLFNLITRGIFLVSHVFDDVPDYPDIFNMNVLRQLYYRFVELDNAFLHATKSKVDIFINRHPSGWHLRPNGFQFPDWETVDGFEALQLKYFNIPALYESNIQSLVQFGSHLRFHVFGMNKTMNKVDELCNRIQNSLSGFVQILDGKLTPAVEDFYDGLKA